MTALRNLLVIATNYLINQNLLTLNSDSKLEDEKGYVITEIAGKKSVINWQDVGFGEIRISIWWDYCHENHPQANLEGNKKERFQMSKPLAKSRHYPKFVGAMASGWLERTTDKHLQGYRNNGLYDTYVRRQNKDELQRVPKAKPIGFKEEGKLFF